MNPRFLLTSLALLLIGAALIDRVFFSAGPERKPGEAEAALEASSGDSTPGALVPQTRGPSSGASDASEADVEGMQRAERRIRDLEDSLALADQLLRRAERDLEASEAEVEELERIIADIKARGDDPADYSDLAMERFQPAFFRFQDAQAAFDNAERLKAETAAALEAARAELARRRSSDGVE